MSVTSAALAEMPLFEVVWPQCVVRAWEDSQFREALMRDPVGTLLGAFQFIVPAGISLEIIEGSPDAQSAPANTLRMVIPPAPEMELREIALARTGEPAGPRPFTFSQLCLC